MKSAMTNFWNYLRTLADECKTFPFLALSLLAVATFYFELCYQLDGASFIIHDFFEGTLVNLHDFTRYVSIIFTHFPVLLYNWIGGKSFQVAGHLFNLGHNYHVFLPFFFLVYLRHRFPELRQWVRDSLYTYVLSLFLYRGMCYLFLISELNFAHTQTWLLLFAFRARTLTGKGNRFLDYSIWNFGLLSLFTYPLSLLSFGLLFLVPFVNPEEGLGGKRKKLLFFFFTLGFLSLAFYLYYRHLFPDSGSFFVDFIKLIKTNATKYILVSYAVFFILLPMFRFQNYIAALLFLYSYFLIDIFRPWQSFGGRTVAIILILIAQAFYLFALPRLRRESIDDLTRRCMIPAMLYVMGLFLIQGFTMKTHMDKIYSFVSESSGTIPYLEAQAHFDKPFLYYSNDWNIRSVSLVVQLTRHNKVRSMVEAEQDKRGNILDIWGTAKFHQKLRDKNIDFPETIIIRDHK